MILSIKNLQKNIVEEKPKVKKKTFFEKFTEGLKDFLDNAE